MEIRMTQILRIVTDLISVFICAIRLINGSIFSKKEKPAEIYQQV